MTVTYAVLDLFSNRRGRDHDMTGDRDVGRVISRHRSMSAAQREAARVLRAVRRGHGRAAYLPLLVAVTVTRPPLGAMLTESDILDAREVGEEDTP